jgi:hypothetical protein
MKCKNCGYTEPKKDKPKENIRLKKINKLLELWNTFEFEGYSGKNNLSTIWEELKKKLLNYKCSTLENTITLRLLVSKLENPPKSDFIDLLKDLK